MTALLSALCAALFAAVFIALFVHAVTHEQSSDGPIAAALIGFVLCAIWLGSALSTLV